MANGDDISKKLLEQAQSDIDDALKQKGLSKGVRVLLESQRTYGTYLLTLHTMVTEMYPVYKAAKEKQETDRDSLLGYKRTAIGSLVLMIVHIAWDALRLPGIH